MGIRIELCEKGGRLEEAVFRFRYAVYVEEMGRPQRYADHQNRLIAEPLDSVSAVFAAVDERGNVVGTIRHTWATDRPESEYTSMYRMEAFEPFFPHRCSFTTKLMVSAAYRGSTLGTRLAIETFDFGARRQIALNFIDCNNNLIPYFKALGYLPFPRVHQHEEYGCVQVMVLPVVDLQHLQSLRSPFFKRQRAIRYEHETLLPFLTTRLTSLS